MRMYIQWWAGMKIEGFEWDEGNWPKCGKHGLEREEIEAVMREGPMVAPDRTGAAEPRLNAVGRLGERHVFVVFTLRSRAGRRYIRPISARYMHDKEVRRYERDQDPKG